MKPSRLVTFGGVQRQPWMTDAGFARGQQVETILIADWAANGHTDQSGKAVKK